MSTATEHEWLRRLSDYHSGGVDAAEAAAVEEHLATCEECREALRVYRRFYLLASSPLRLGEPSDAVAEQLSMTDDVSDRFTGGVRLGRRPAWPSTLPPERSRLLGIASILAASLIIVGFLAVFGARIGSSGKHPTPTPSPSATPSGPTPTAQTTHLPAAGTGYINAGPDWATELAFAPSATNTVYACGMGFFSSGSGGFLFSVSTDGGHTWKSQASPGTLPAKVPETQVELELAQNNYLCYLTVDPTAPRDLALMDLYCIDVTSENPYQCKANAEGTQLYRSFDGGESWSLINTPTGDGMIWYEQTAWVGSDLFVGTTEGIVRSVAGGPFTLLQQLYFGTGSQTEFNRGLYVIGNSLIVQDIQCTQNPGENFCSGPTARSDDQGGHWSLVAMSYQSALVGLMLVGADGKTLIGRELQTTTSPFVVDNQLLRSVDGGATWSPLPPAPQPSSVSTSGGPIAVAPDGTIYAWFLFFSVNSEGIGSNALGVYELAPRALNWRYFAPSSGGPTRIFRWSSSGRVAVIWGERGSPHVSGFQYRVFSS